MTIRLLSVSDPGTLRRDRPPRGVPSKGDVVVVSSVLRNRVPQFGAPKGAVVGGDYAVLTVVSKYIASVNVRVTLPGGTLRVSGRENGKKTSGTLPVVGGTGRFAGARGTSYIRNVDKSSTRAVNVYRLRIP